ncbi:probable plastid-lipid-associated protein 14, chloroplastic isoform X1 [Amborella trichopoda]|uniref:probable plastid-lipid-associated protein 14, chloroplastic isoform X1 n=2 Tax=Amborella trichopoda TaxID=13333 RepID=UPI0009BC8B2C|nr:probable plastid-lipid-associated protein 14, chloroplastic isoform X1 [Amborella trichopoda]|eukprot:XP_011626322.2 probable plastid-lipid-associated protein 14, chloroplastic isoform X1 [Amborella trichopoda]
MRETHGATPFHAPPSRLLLYKYPFFSSASLGSSLNVSVLLLHPQLADHILMAFSGAQFKSRIGSCDPIHVYRHQRREWKERICGIAKSVYVPSSQRKLFASHLYSGSQRSLPLRGIIKVTCSQGNSIAPPETNEDSDYLSSFMNTNEVGSITKFKMSDFVLCNHVSIGLAGKGDEVIFEAIVRDSHSPLYNSKVVLRQLASFYAQRRGRRALEVLKKLARQKLMYHSYAMQVHGFVSPSNGVDHGSFTLVHGYHGSFSLQHWLQQADWLPTLEATLALDEECARRVGDATVGGPAVSRQLRLIRILMRDLLIGVNYLHSHGLAHTELRLENVHISPVDRHVKVGILGNASYFHDSDPLESNIDRRQMMIAFDIRCVGFMMAKMVLRELMDPSIFTKFKSFLTKGNDPSCLREFLLPLLSQNSPSGNIGLQMLDRNWGAGWNLLSLMLATKPAVKISCLDALRHPFLCGPRWRVDPSMELIKWSLGSMAVKITEEYIYGLSQRNRLAYFIELLEMLNPYPKLKNWPKLLPGTWRLLYCTGTHIGLTLRQASPSLLIGNAYLTITPSAVPALTFSLSSNIDFTLMPQTWWPHNKKTNFTGKLKTSLRTTITSGIRHYLDESLSEKSGLPLPESQESTARKSAKWGRQGPFSLPIARVVPVEELVVGLELGFSPENDETGGKILKEVRLQIPPEMFDLSKITCGTYVDERLLVLRGVSGLALLFTRSFPDHR